MSLIITDAYRDRVGWYARYGLCPSRVLRRQDHKGCFSTYGRSARPFRADGIEATFPRPVRQLQIVLAEGFTPGLYAITVRYKFRFGSIHQNGFQRVQCSTCMPPGVNNVAYCSL